MKLIKSDNPKLTTPSKEVKNIKTAVKFGKGMLSFLAGTKSGVGLSAVQVGYMKKLFVVRYQGLNQIFINPEILGYSVDTDIMEEGCLTYPGQSNEIRRSISIEIRYTNDIGKSVTKIFTGFVARIIQHEYDHLNGISCMDKVMEE
jgi:peptide deformylase